MKKFLACLMATLTLLTSLSVCMVYAVEESDFTYDTRTNWETEIVEVHITGYNGIDTEVVIPDTIEGNSVTVIDNSAFKGNEKITSVTVPSSVKVIEDYAFEDCTNLSELNLPATIEYFGNRAMDNTAIYNDTKNWDGGVLYYNNFLIEATSGCEGEYKVKDGTVLIAGDAFSSNRDVTSVIFPSSLKYVNSDAFEFCRNIEKVTLNEGLEVIGAGAFAYTAIEEIKLPNSLKVIDSDAFDSTKITKIHIPANVTEISDTAFSDLEAEEFTVDSNNKNFYIADGVLFQKAKEYQPGDILLYYPALKEGSSYTIPDGVYDLGFAAFTNVKNLKELNIPASVGYFFVYRALSIEKFNVAEDNENYYSIDGAVYRKSDKELIAYPSANQNEKFVTAEGTENVSFNVINPNPYIKEVTFTEGIKSIDSAIAHCDNLETVNLPSTLEYLSSYAFDYCPKLKTINFNGTMAEFKEFTLFFFTAGDVVNGLYTYCTDGTIELVAPEGSTTTTEPEEITTAPITITEPEEITTAPATTTEPEEITTAPVITTEPQESATATKPQESSTAPAGDKKFEKGDANMDGKLNIRDATSIQKHLAKVLTLSEKALELADFNGDAKLNIKDATTIQKRIAGIV